MMRSTMSLIAVSFIAFFVPNVRAQKQKPLSVHIILYPISTSIALGLIIFQF